MSQRPAILYIDDEEMNLTLFRVSFEGKREVLVANSPDEAMRKIEENKYRIKAIISDMNMPEMNGVQFIEKAKEQLSGIPYFILSGYAYNDEIDQALKRNMIQRFFTKPFNREEIESHLNGAA